MRQFRVDQLKNARYLTNSRDSANRKTRTVTGRRRRTGPIRATGHEHAFYVQASTCGFRIPSEPRETLFNNKSPNKTPYTLPVRVAVQAPPSGNYQGVLHPAARDLVPLRLSICTSLPTPLPGGAWLGCLVVGPSSTLGSRRRQLHARGSSVTAPVGATVGTERHVRNLCLALNPP